MTTVKRYTTGIDPVTGKFGLIPVESIHSGLEVGQRVIGEYGMCFCERGIFFVYSEPDERGNQILVEQGGDHRFSDVNAVEWGCKPISQKFGIGTYWDDSEEWRDYRMSREELDQLYKECEEQKKRNEEEQQRQKEADEKADRERTAEWERKYGKVLKPITTDNHYGKEYRAQVRHNVLALIKHCLPGFKYSLTRYDYGYDFELSWVDGPTEKEVREAIPFEVFKTCWGELRIDDYYDTHHIRNSFAAKYGDCGEGIRLDRRYSDPDGWRKYKEVSFYVKPEPKPVAPAKDYEPTKAKGIAMIDTEEGFCLTGRATYFIRRDIKALGGNWDKEQQAWCFTNDKRDDVIDLLER